VRKPGPTLMIAFGMPGQHGEQQDEDQLDRERDAGEGDGDISTEAIVSIIHNLHEGGPAAVRELRAFIKALQEITDTFMARDQAGLEEAAAHACDVLQKMMSN
jgi:hypothetical protein